LPEEEVSFLHCIFFTLVVLVGSCVGVFFLSVLSEFLRFKRSSLARQVPEHTSSPLSSQNTNDVTSIGESKTSIEDQSPDEFSGSTVTLSRETGTDSSRQQEYR